MSTATELMRLVVHEITAYGQVTYKTLEQIENFLAAEPEAEPFGYVSRHGIKGAFELQFNRKLSDVYRDTALSITPVYAHPLRPEPEAEPVAWIQPNHLDKAQFMPFLCRVEPKQRDDFVPLYTRPSPTRKPLTEDEIKAGHKDSNCYVLLCIDPLCNFSSGIRFAEKHHGITASDLTLQDQCRGDKL
jgi:hypothetical protein